MNLSLALAEPQSISTKRAWPYAVQKNSSQSDSITKAVSCSLCTCRMQLEVKEEPSVHIFVHFLTSLFCLFQIKPLWLLHRLQDFPRPQALFFFGILQTCRTPCPSGTETPSPRVLTDPIMLTFLGEAFNRMEATTGWPAERHKMWPCKIRRIHSPLHYEAWRWNPSPLPPRMSSPRHATAPKGDSRHRGTPFPYRPFWLTWRSPPAHHLYTVYT